MELRDWQAKEKFEHAHEPKRAIFADPRLGKTLAAIVCAEEWPWDPQAGPILVVCPLVVAPQWERELAQQGYRACNLYSGTRNERLKRLAAFKGKYAITNYDVLGYLPNHWFALIGDESHYIKGVSSDRGKRFRQFARSAKYVRLLTGTPAPNHYGDLWGQLAALDSREWGSYESFARRYLIRDRMFPTKVTGHINVSELQERVNRVATFVRREDVFGPDTYQTVTRTIELPKSARGLYDQLAKEWIAEIEGGKVTADHILTRLIRLQQISSGFVPNEHGDMIAVHQAKYVAVQADLGEIVESGEKAVIFHRFRPEGDAYFEMAQRFPALAIQINGDVPVEDRDELRRSFQEYDGPAIAVVQTQAGAIGVEFSEANHALFASRSFSYTEDYQALSRIYKPGAVRVVTYYETERTIDTYISKVLGLKKNVHDSVTHADHRAMAWGSIGG